MKAKILSKSELRWPELVRDYTFDITDDEGETILASQSVVSSPTNIRGRLEEIVSEYELAFADANDVDEGDII